ncbi:hypothetical protein L195_g060005, partial [Trifolium pratense]
EAFAQRTGGEQLATARHEQVFHWCGSLWLSRPSLSEQLATARHESVILWCHSLRLATVRSANSTGTATFVDVCKCN